MSAQVRPRGGRALAVTTALFLAGCELVAGLLGEREVVAPATERGGSAGTMTSGGTSVSAGRGSGGSASNLGGSGVIGGGAGTEEGGDAGEENGGHGGAAGNGVEGGAGGVDGDPDGPLYPVKSCDETTVCAGESACTTLYVRGGEFPMGRSTDGNDAAPLDGKTNEVPEHMVRVSSFWLDKYEVTVGRFRRFVESYVGTPPVPGAGAHSIVQSGWKTEWNDRLPIDRLALEQAMVTFSADDNCVDAFRTWTQAAGNNECLPVNCVDWFVSFAFCIWDGGRLPTEAEWEYAAAGAEENRLYPWGPEIPGIKRAVFGCAAAGNKDCGPTDITEVGSRGKPGIARFGHADLAGSMMERTRDVYDPTYYDQPAASIENAVNLGLDATRIESPTRGGNFVTPDAADLRVTRRISAFRTSRWDGIGIRCARNP